MRSKPHVCIFAKAPRPGAAKTRLASRLGTTTAAALAKAFLRDTWSAVSSLPWAQPILATPDPDPKYWRFLPRAEIWFQGHGDLGQRVERVLRRALRVAPFVVALGSDTPGLPGFLLEGARKGLARSDAVLGPCEDGGFYLLGLKRCSPGLLRNLPWSAGDTCSQMLRRLRRRGYQIQLLPPWFDVDRIGDLRCLKLLLSRQEISAPHTARLLAKMRLPGGDAKDDRRVDTGVGGRGARPSVRTGRGTDAAI